NSCREPPMKGFFMSTTDVLQPTLRAQDPDLPLLAARAAIELDNLRRKKSSDLNAVKMISDRLHNALISNGENRLILDSSTAAIVGHALHSAVPNITVTSTDQLIDEARALAKKMGQLTTTS